MRPRLDLYKSLRSSGNLVFSPFSVRTALLMARVGAVGQTATQMDAALRIPPADSTEHTALYDVIARSGAQRGCEMNVANSLWVQDGEPLRNAFIEEVEH
jgi:serpin B